MTAPQEVVERVFDVMGELVDAISNAIAQDPDTREDAGEDIAFLRADGVSITYVEAPPNEMVFKLQVPMDSIIAWHDANDKAQA